MVSSLRAALRALGLVGVAVVAAAACQHTGDDLVVSPASDNHPSAQTSDGRVVGADDKSPQHLLAEQGTSAHPAPGWKIDQHGVAYDPKRRPSDSDPGSTKLTLPDAGTETVPKQSKPTPSPGMPEE